MTNDEMKAGRFLRRHRARVRHGRIQDHLAKGGCVLVATYTTFWIHRDPDRFQCRRDGVYVRRAGSGTASTIARSASINDQLKENAYETNR